MKILTRKQMQETDKYAIEKLKIPSIILMENAGLAVVEVIYNNYMDLARGGVIVLCGSGNNGGDGMVVARHLFLRNIPVKVFVASKVSKLKSDTLTQFNIIKNLRIPIYYLEEAEDEQKAEEEFIQRLTIELGFNSLLIDALVGIGIKTDVGKFYDKIIQNVNRFGSRIISVDVPSGLDVDTGKFFASEPIRAMCTVTFAYPKPGLFLYPAYLYVGKLIVANISIPYNIDKKDNPNINVILPFEVADSLNYFPPNYNKTKLGNVLIVGGSYRYTGAPVLASKAAFATNAGMVYLLVDKSIHNIIASKTQEEIVEYYDKTNYKQQLENLYQRVNTILFGNGIENNSINNQILEHIVSNFKGVLVVDGTGIHMFYDYFIKNKNDFKTNLKRIILTPHSGELSSFFTKVSSKVKVSLVEDIDRLNNSSRLASLIPNSIIVSKGNPTFICYYDEVDNVYINITNGIGLAKAGSGDVLAGIISALTAASFYTLNNKFEDIILEAAKTAVFIHGLSAQISRKDRTVYSVTPTEVIKNIPKAFEYIIQKYSVNPNIISLNSFSKSIIEYLQIIEI
ncbi:MAG: NAD(P)H-hydrate epimerase [bacterium]